MKRIVLCFDGTWNRPADEALPAAEQIETNVSRFYKAVSDTGSNAIRQVKWYDEGVGTHWFDRFLGGGLGAGLEFNIIEGYKFLASQYEDGDEVYVLGFSRGAYTARSLVGMIRNCGLIDKGLVGLKVGIAYGIYRTRDDGPDSRTARLFRSMFAKEVPIKFLGVWDTVGALGIPLDLLQTANMKFYEFHDTTLSGIVQNAYHAIAIDEHRQDYDACLWDPREKPRQNFEQRWFVGAHCDIGGGYLDRRLSDIPLGWMGEKAALSGLTLSPVKADEKNYLGPWTDSYSKFLKGGYSKLHPRHYRSIGRTKFGSEVVDDLVQKRRRDDLGYRPGNVGLAG
jgi:uncharacterized protein (DUF2235 family)